MATPITSPATDLPKFRVASRIAWTRVGAFPVVQVAHDGCIYLTGAYADVLVSDATTITANIDAVEGDLVNHTIVNSVGDAIGVVTSAVRNIDDTAWVLTMSGFAVPVGASVARVYSIPTNPVAYTMAVAGRRKFTTLDGSNADAMSRVMTMMGTISFNFGRALLQQLAISSGVSDANLQAAIQTMDSSGKSIDSFFAEQADALADESDAGQLPYQSPMMSPI